MSWLWNFQANCPNQKILTISEVKEIEAIEEATSGEEVEDEDQTLITQNIGEFLVI